jgi:hypothetical protein
MPFQVNVSPLPTIPFLFCRVISSLLADATSNNPIGKEQIQNTLFSNTRGAYIFSAHLGRAGVWLWASSWMIV